MSCLRIRLSPAKSAWKRFASKLCKFHRPISKPSKKLCTPPVVASALKPIRPSSRHPSKYRKDRSSRVFLVRLKRACLFKKKRKSFVYVDKLFKDPSVVTKTSEIDDAADEAWESMCLASPLVHGIDARAEEFIARIKAEIKSQHTIAPAL